MYLLSSFLVTVFIVGAEVCHLVYGSPHNAINYPAEYVERVTTLPQMHSYRECKALTRMSSCPKDLTKLEPLSSEYLNLLAKTISGNSNRSHYFRGQIFWDRYGKVRDVTLRTHNETASYRPNYCHNCYTQVGLRRLLRMQEPIAMTISEGVSGDWVETGAWRGGISMNARAVQKVFGQDKSRRVYVCDSFQGIPYPSYDVDKDDKGWEKPFIAVSLDEVWKAFDTFNLLDENIVFVKGFFRDSLPILRNGMLKERRQIAILYIDANLFESYYDVLYNLYDLVAVGGWVILDDVRSDAVEKFRRDNNINDQLYFIDGYTGSTAWRKSSYISTNNSVYQEFNSRRPATPIKLYTKFGDIAPAAKEGYPIPKIIFGPLAGEPENDRWYW